MDVHKMHNFIVFVHTKTQWVKQACPTEPIFLTTMLVIGTQRGMPEDPASKIYFTF